MKKILLTLLFLAFASTFAVAQQKDDAIKIVGVVPATCVTNVSIPVIYQGTIYTCVTGNYYPIATTAAGGTVTGLTANRAVYATSPTTLGSATTTLTELNYLSGVTSAVQTQLNGKATTALDNLASVSINTTLLAQTGTDLGSTVKPFRDLYLYGAGTYGTNYFRVTGTPTGARVVTLPDASITMAGSASALTSGRVPFATTGGLLTDRSGFTFSSSGLSVSQTGAQTFTFRSTDNDASIDLNGLSSYLYFHQGGNTNWQVYLTNGSSVLRFWDTTNSRLHASFAQSSTTDGANTNFNSKVAIGTTSGATANLDVIVNSSSRIGQIIKLAASQSADALQVQKSDGTVYTKIDSIGTIVGIAGTATATSYTFATATSTGVGMFLYDPNTIGFRAQGNTGFNVAQGAARFATNLITWGSDFNNTDIGITRNAAGILEINNGTAGTYRDLRLRYLGVGATAGTYPINFAYSSVDGSPIYGFEVAGTTTTTSSAATYHIGQDFTVTTGPSVSTTDSGYKKAMRAQIYAGASHAGTLGTMEGAYITAYIDSSAPSTAVISQLAALHLSISNAKAGAMITTGYGLQIDSAANSGTFTSNAAIAIGAQSAATNNTALLIGTTTIPSGNYAIYSNSGTNYFTGPVNIGTTSLGPGTYLRINNTISNTEGALLFNLQSIMQATTGDLSGNSGAYFQTIYRSAAYKISTISNLVSLAFLRPEMTNATDIAADTVDVFTAYPAIYGSGSTKGTYTNTHIIRASTLSNQIAGGDFRFTSIHGVYVENVGTPSSNAGSTVTNASGITIFGITGATNNVGLLMGTTTIPTGNYGAFIISSAATAIPLYVKGAVSQSGSLSQWANSGGTVLHDINSGGMLTIGTASTSLDRAIWVKGPAWDTSTSLYVFMANHTAPATATVSVLNFYSRALTAASAYTLTSLYNFYADSPSLGAGSAITTAYGLYIAKQKQTGVTTGYGVYQANSADLNYFAGLIRVGSTSTGIAENAAGILEINNGSAGTYRDLRARSIGLGTTPSSTQFLSINQGVTDVSGGAFISTTGILQASAAGVSTYYGVLSQPILRSTAQTITTGYGQFNQVFLLPEMTNSTDIAVTSVIANYSRIAIYGSGSTRGTFSNNYGLVLDSPSNQIAAAGPFVFTNMYGALIQNQGTVSSNAGASVTNAAGLAIAAQSGATNNTHLLIGTATIPSGNYAIYSSSTNRSKLSGGLDVTSSPGASNYGFNATTTYAGLSVGSSDIYGNYLGANYNGDTTSGAIYANWTEAYIQGASTLNRLYTAIYRPYVQGSGTITTLEGLTVDPYIYGASASLAITNFFALHAAQGAYGGGATSTITNFYGLKIENISWSNVTNNYGIHIANQTAGGTLNYAIYSAGGASLLNAGTASVVPLTIKGAASQSGDLFQAQDSSAGVRAKINKDGDFVFQSSNTSGVSSITHNNDSINFGAIASAYGGIGFVGSSAPTTANYALAGDFSGTLTLLNVGTGGTISFRVNNSAAATLTSSAFTMGSAVNFFVGPSTIETFTTTSSAFSATLNYYTDSQTIYRNTGTAANDVTVNVDASASVDLNTRLATGQAITVVVTITNGGVTAYKVTALNIHGSAQTIKWPGGTAATGNLSAEDWYTFTILKTGASTYYVTGVQTSFK